MIPLFTDGSRAAHDRLRHIVGEVLDVFESSHRSVPFPSLEPVTLASKVAQLDPLPEGGFPLEDVLAEVGEVVLANAARPTNPRCAAHLHSPPLLTAAAAEIAIGLTNQSMDSFDQAPAATQVEDTLVRRIAAVIGLPDGASGVMTTGGTSSNLLGLLLARDRAHRSAGGAAGAGLPPDAGRWRIIASAGAHVSVRQAAAVLGLGRDAVLPVATDSRGRMDVHALDTTLDALRRRNEVAIAIVGTAGTTDAGAVDPLIELADRAAAQGCWFHVDAAVGGGFALSEKARQLITGIERADSVTVDLHKLWWQPISASVLLVRDGAMWAGLRESADYLNREEDQVLNLVDRSLDTSRRFDALKALISLRVTGRAQMGELVDHVMLLATAAAEHIDRHADLELLCPPQTITVLFRCRPDGAGVDGLDSLNTRVQQQLLTTGQAVVGRTRWHGQVALKLTLVNPLAGADDVADLLDLIATTASAEQVVA
jgi:L-2,4-diaminobutyrate decarboxylase